MIAETFVPASITGFFGIVRSFGQGEGGSFGFSVCLSHGMHVLMQAEVAERNSFKTFSGGRSVVVPVSDTVADMMILGMPECHDISIWYESDLPIGCGFGMSGATALGTARCLSKLTGAGDDYIHHAYTADVICQSGYGDVVAQSRGGALIRGTPGLTKDTIAVNHKGYKVFSAVFGPISTKDVLRNENVSEKMSKLGKRCLSSAVNDPSIENIMHLCSEFTSSCPILTHRLSNAIDSVSEVNAMPASMIMIGEGLFTFVHEKDVPSLIEALKGYDVDLFISDVWGGTRK